MMELNDSGVKKAAAELVNTINSETLLYQDKCEPLTLAQKVDAVKLGLRNVVKECDQHSRGG